MKSKIKLIGKSGETIFINTDHIVALIAERSNGTKIVTVSEPIFVKEDISTIAVRINEL